MPEETRDHCIYVRRKLYVAIELSSSTWRLALSDGSARKPREVAINAGDLARLEKEFGEAKKKFGLPVDCTDVVCSEAGRDGFSVHRALVLRGVESLVVDPASVEVDRRKRRAKTDRLDAQKLLRHLIRHHNGERNVWRVVQVPSQDVEDERELHRERERLIGERTRHRNRLKGLLAKMGIKLQVGVRFAEQLDSVTTLYDTPLPPALKSALLREFQRLQLVDQQLGELTKELKRRVQSPETELDQKAAALAELRGIGPIGAWVVVKEFLGWRDFRNRRQVGSAAGLTGTPYDTGESRREQGISKAGNARIRKVMVEMAWGWLRYQTDRQLSKWWRARFGDGGRRVRCKGIVALARRLLIALWKLLQFGLVPEGAALTQVAVSTS